MKKEPKKPERYTIIARTPTFESQCCNHGFVCIRESDDEYVVHNVSTDEHGEIIAYFWGHYFPKGEEHALREAMAIFVRKTIDLYGLTDRIKLSR